MQTVIERAGGDILVSQRFQRGFQIRHHGRQTVSGHSIRVAQAGYALTRRLAGIGIHIDETDVIRAALLHDIGMTEGDVYARHPFRKCFLHPKAGALIACNEFRANRIQLNAIRRHMWPAGLIPPKHAVGWMIWIADHYCTIRELGKPQ